MACRSRASRWTARCCRTSPSPSRRRSRRSPRRPRPRWRPEAFSSQRLLRIMLGGPCPAERVEREIHGAGLVPVPVVAGLHLLLIGARLRRLELGQEVALAFLLHGVAELDVGAGA